MNDTIIGLPPTYKGKRINVETIRVMRALSKTHRKLAELKGYSDIVPNKDILINAITINESKDSSEIENIITTHDELFRTLSMDNKNNMRTKEVLNYKSALWKGSSLIKNNGLLTINMIIEIQQIIEGNSEGIRKQSGTVLRNDRTGAVVYEPPQSEMEIIQLLKNLKEYINNDNGIDDLIKMAIIHYQFESIHPFYDGNGRTGRIINVLYLQLKDLLDSPILYLSKYILSNKNEYYRLLQEVRINGNWEEWIIYILKGIEEMSTYTLKLLKRIVEQIDETAEIIKNEQSKLYSKELVNIIFSEFYIRIENVQNSLGVTRKTASNYLNKLVDIRVLSVEIFGRDKIFINHRLIDLIANNH